MTSQSDFLFPEGQLKSSSPGSIVGFDLLSAVSILASSAAVSILAPFGRSETT
jgi:hypothetical protein